MKFSLEQTVDSFDKLGDAAFMAIKVVYRVLMQTSTADDLIYCLFHWDAE